MLRLRAGDLRDEARHPPALPRQRRGTLVLDDQAAVRQQLRVARGDRERVTGVGLVARADHDRRTLDLLERVQVGEGRRARRGPQRVGNGIEVVVIGHPLAHRPADGLAPALGQPLPGEGLREAVDAAHAQRVAQAHPSAPAADGARSSAGSKPGVMATSAATRSGASSASRRHVCAPIETPASTARRSRARRAPRRGPPRDARTRRRRMRSRATMRRVRERRRRRRDAPRAAARASPSPRSAARPSGHAGG